MPPGEGTVRGTFDLSAEPALRSIRDLRSTARDTDQTFRRLGASIDTYATQVDRGFSKMARSASEHTKEINVSVDSSIDKVREFGRLDEKARIGLDGAQDATDDIRTLSDDVRDFGRMRETAHVRISGIAEANRQLDQLDARLTRFSHRHATATARIRTTGGGGLGRGLGQAAGGGGGGLSAPPMGLLGLGGLGLLPLIQALGGTGIGIAGSAASAAAGAGVVGGAGLATLGIGLAPAFGVVKDFTKDIGTAMKAQQAYNMTVAQYGVASKQAATAKQRLDAVFAQNPGIRKATQELDQLHQAVTRAIVAPTRGTVAAAIGTTIGRVRTQALPAVAPGARLDIQATSQQATRFGGFLTRPGGPVLAAITATQRQFFQDAPIMERTLENIATLFANVERAALPFFHEANLWVEHTTAGWAQWSQNTSRVNTVLDHGVTSFTKWRDLTSATFRTLRDLFSIGRPTGDSAIQSLTDQLNQWDAWIKRNPAKVQQFFHDAWDSTKRIAGAVYEIAKALGQVSNLLLPVLSRFADLTQLLGGAGLLLPIAARAGLGYVLGKRDPAVAAMLGGRGAAGLGAAAGAAGAGGAAAQMGFFQNSRFAYSAGRASGAGILRSGLGVAGGLGLRALGATAGIALPLMGLSAGLSVLQNGSGGQGLPGLLRNALSGATLGIVSPLVNISTSEVRDRALQAAIQNITTGRRATFDMGGGVQGQSNLFARYFVGPAGQQARFGGPITQGLTRSAQRRLGLQTYGPVGPPIPTTPTSVDQAVGGYRELTQLAHRAQFEITTSSGKAKAAAQEQLHAIFQIRAAYLRFMQDDSRRLAQQFSQNFGSAFTYYSKRDGPIKAMGEMRTGIVGEMHRLDPAGKRVLANNAVAWAYQMQKDNPRLRQPYLDLVKNIQDQFSAMGQHIKVVNGQILDNSRTQWLNIASNIQGPMQVAAAKTMGLFDEIQRAAIAKLLLMGFSRTQATQLVQGIESGKIDPRSVGKGSLSPTSVRMTAANTPRSGRATGGRLEGFGMHDTIKMADGGRGAPGELVLNRHTEADVNRDLMASGKRTLGSRVALEHRPHSLGPAGPTSTGTLRALGGSIGAGLASVLGGLRSGGGGGGGLRSQASLAGVHQGVLDAARAIESHFPGLTITSSTSGGHASGSYHYLGEALDLAGASGEMFQAANWIKSSGLYRSLVEGIHNPNLSVKSGAFVSPGFWGPATWAQHLNHIHIAVLGAALGAFSGGGAGGAGGAPMSISLNPPRSGLPGIPGVYADAASRNVTGGLVSRINQALAQMGGGGTPGSVASGPAQKMIFDFFSRAGMSKIGIAGLIGNAVQESSLNWGAPGGGMWQQISNFGSGAPSPLVQMQKMLGQIRASGVFAAMNAASSPEQAAAIFEQGFEKAGIPAMGNRTAAARAAFNAGFARGGRLGRPEWMGWFAHGTDFTTTPGRPVMFGAGERERERVQITRAGRGGGQGGRQVVVQPGAIVVHGGDKDPEQIAQYVVTKLIDAIDRGEVPDSALA